MFYGFRFSALRLGVSAVNLQTAPAGSWQIPRPQEFGDSQIEPYGGVVDVRNRIYNVGGLSTCLRWNPLSLISEWRRQFDEKWVGY